MQIDTAMSSESLSIPVIDMANFPAELNKLALAATRLGCFRVINHGMPANLSTEITPVVRSLFALPTQAKLRNSNAKIHNGGYVPFGKLAPMFEAFGIYDASSSADIHSFCSVMQLSPRQCQIVSQYIANLHMVMMKLASKMTESLGLAGRSFEEWSCDAKFSHYNFNLQQHIGYVVAPNHTDSGFLTLLQEDECVRGLEIMDGNGKFVTIEPVPGTFLAIIGDAGKVWSNGRLTNVKHRVVCKEVMPRISIILFLLSPKDDRIETDVAFIDSEHPRLYQTFNYKEYKKMKSLCGVDTDEMLPRWGDMKTT